MTKRPTFWIHRTFRFWSGLATVLFLLGTWISTTFRGKLLEYRTERPSMVTSVHLGVEKGGLQLRWRHWNPGVGASPVPLSDWKIENSWGSGAKLRPELEWRDQRHPGYRERSFSVFLPLWIPLMLWIPLWLLWMHRAEKKEALLFSKAIVSPDEPVQVTPRR